MGRKILDNKDIVYKHVDYEMDSDMASSKKGLATYTQIKNWIKEQYGVSVSSLYVAQMKDKMGLEKRENYNTGAEGHRVPKCPPEKEEMILEAFKHFGMIE